MSRAVVAVALLLVVAAGALSWTIATAPDADPNPAPHPTAGASTTTCPTVLLVRDWRVQRRALSLALSGHPGRARALLATGYRALPVRPCGVG